MADTPTTDPFSVLDPPAVAGAAPLAGTSTLGASEPVAPEAVPAFAEAIAVAVEEVRKKKKAKKDKEPEPEIDPDDPDSLFRAMGPRRGVETLFRSSYRVNMDLTSLADAKANIMISVNGFIVSILIAAIAPKVDANPWLLIPTSVFLIGCVVSLIFAVLSARPRVTSHHVTLDEIRRNKTNILFFGNFASLKESDYQIAMKERMMDPVALYELMITDIYGVGAVLERKYKLLRGAYTSFLSALIVGVIAFILVFGYAAFFESGPTVVTPVGVDATGTTIFAPPPVPAP
ncbi:MAG TPA: Pycsar system effector family protein [Rubricoccaceae bacterium]|jgi:hypothetical protein